MKYSEKFVNRLHRKAHDDLFAVGRGAEQFNMMYPDTAQNPVSNRENAAINAMLKRDPYAADREKTQMRRDQSGELAVQPIN